MTSDQFAALALLLRLRQGSAKDAAKLVMVQGIPTADAARTVSMDYRAATYAVKRVRTGLQLSKVAAGTFGQLGITEDQFIALAKLLRLGPPQKAVHLVMVQGLQTADAARAVGMDYRAATYAVKRAHAGLLLAKQAAGISAAALDFDLKPI